MNIKTKNLKTKEIEKQVGLTLRLISPTTYKSKQKTKEKGKKLP